MIAPEAEIEVIGIRPGEKLHEVLINEDEARSTWSVTICMWSRDPLWQRNLQTKAALCQKDPPRQRHESETG